jgi:HlyD family secretion protein
MRVVWPTLSCAVALLGGCSSDTPSGYQGYVEGEYVHVASPLGGRLDKLLVQRGQTIDAKAPLFKLEADEETAAKQQAAQQLKRDQAQYEVGGIARAQLDDSRSNLALKSARVRELAGQLQVSRLPARTEQIRAQDAQVAAARALSSQWAWRLNQKEVAAAQPGLVVDTLYREGEWVPAGRPVVRLLPPQNVKVRFFVPESVVGAIQPGRKVLLHCDGCAAEVPAAVSFIADAPEYTPPVIYSNQTRAKLVFMVEARPAAQSAAALRPGQPVTVTLQ